MAPSDTLTARFWGKLGPDSCSRLKRVDKGHGPGIIELEFHGERTHESGMDCLHMPVFLEHEEKVLPPLDDPFTIRVLQPDGAPLEKVVSIR